MKAQLLALTTIFAATQMEAQDEISSSHYFVPKVFYRIHQEQGYNYSTTGIGLEYGYEKPEGLNIQLSYLTNPFPFDDHLLMEGEGSLSYKFYIDQFNTLYPIFSNRLSTHRVQKEGSTKWSVHKQTFFGGLGWEFSFLSNLQMQMEVQAFRDIHNMYVTVSPYGYTGYAFSNPYGVRIIPRLSYGIQENHTLELEGNYCHTFPKCYKQVGCEISYKWRF